MGLDWIAGWSCASPNRSSQRVRSCKGTSTQWRWSLVARRYGARRPPFWTLRRVGRSCSTWATASCHKRRPSMWRASWSRCVRPKVAVVLFNLGGPDRPQAIWPFLLNLFNDPAILRVPFFVRPLLARRIASARLEPARTSYAVLDGRSPLLDLTQKQA